MLVNFGIEQCYLDDTTLLCSFFRLHPTIKELHWGSCFFPRRISLTCLHFQKLCISIDALADFLGLFGKSQSKGNVLLLSYELDAPFPALEHLQMNCSSRDPMLEELDNLVHMCITGSSPTEGRKVSTLTLRHYPLSAEASHSARWRQSRFAASANIKWSGLDCILAWPRQTDPTHGDGY